MNYSDRGFALVHILSARTGRAGKFYPQIPVRNLEISLIDLLEFRNDFNERERRVPLTFRVEWRDSDKAMHSGLTFEYTICAGAYDFKCYIPKSPMIILIFVDYLVIQSASIDEFYVHFIEHPREIFRVITARARENRNNSIAFVVFAETRELFFQIGNFLYDRLRFYFVSPKIRR